MPAPEGLDKDDRRLWYSNLLEQSVVEHEQVVGSKPQRQKPKQEQG